MLEISFLRLGALALFIACAACSERPAAGPREDPAAAVPAARVEGPGDAAPTQRPSVNVSESPTPEAPTVGALVITSDQVRAARSPELARCLDSGNAAKGVSVAMGGCFNAELKLQDARLNAAYRDAMARRDAAGQARLRVEERAWIRQRDAGCAEAATGGTIDQVEIPACHLDETVRRRLVLEATDAISSRKASSGQPKAG